MIRPWPSHESCERPFGAAVRGARHRDAHLIAIVARPPRTRPASLPSDICTRSCPRELELAAVGQDRDSERLVGRSLRSTSCGSDSANVCDIGDS